jgi:hypothetical protein
MMISAKNSKEFVELLNSLHPLVDEYVKEIFGKQFKAELASLDLLKGEEFFKTISPDEFTLFKLETSVIRNGLYIVEDLKWTKQFIACQLGKSHIDVSPEISKIEKEMVDVATGELINILTKHFDDIFNIYNNKMLEEFPTRYAELDELDGPLFDDEPKKLAPNDDILALTYVLDSEEEDYLSGAINIIFPHDLVLYMLSLENMGDLKNESIETLAYLLPRLPKDIAEKVYKDWDNDKKNEIVAVIEKQKESPLPMIARKAIASNFYIENDRPYIQGFIDRFLKGEDEFEDLDF